MILINQSMDVRFTEQMQYLKKKYKAEMFDLEGIGDEDLDINAYSQKFFGDKNTVADKTVDANSNIEDTSVITWEKESQKPILKLNALYIIWKRVLDKQGIKRANKLIEAEINGTLRTHDLHKFTSAYCYATQLSRLISDGMPFYKKIKIGPIKHLSSFYNVSLQYISYLSNQIAGAVAIPTFLVDASYFVKKDFGEEWYKDEKAVSQLKELNQSFIYSLNFPWRSNQCVKETTEVATPSGFKKYNQLMQGDDIYVWKNGELAIDKVKAINVYDYDGLMHKYEGRDIVQTVTPNHRVLRKINNSDNYELIESYRLFDCLTPLTVPVASKTYGKEDYEISDDLLKMLTIILCDGCICLDGRISISKSKKRATGNALIRELLVALGMNHTVTTKKSEFKGCDIDLERYTSTYEVDEFRIHKSSADIIKNYLQDKKKLPPFFFLLSRRQANLVLDTWAAFDGNIEVENYEKTKLQCDNDDIVDGLQHIALIAGRGCRSAERCIGTNKASTKYVMLYHRNNKTCREKTEVYYKGKVWCPTTEAGIVAFREEGKIYFSGNSPFTNISVFDRYWLEALFGNYCNADFSKVDFDNVQRLQKLFIDVLLDNQKKAGPFTFPVMTAAMLYDKDKKDFKDQAFFKWISEISATTGLFNFYIDSDISSLSSCCRLKSNLKEAYKEYTNSFGVGGLDVGSTRVVTLNLPQIGYMAESWEDFIGLLEHRVEMCHDILDIHRELLLELIEDGRQPLYQYGFMHITKQFNTVGFIGLYEALELQDLDITTEEGSKKAMEILNLINDLNAKRAQKTGYMYNLEQVPGESAAVTFARKDKIQFSNAKYDLYSNQYIPLTKDVPLSERILAQGRFDKSVGGGSILHINVDEELKSEQVEKLIRFSAESGVVYFALNLSVCKCLSCGKTFTGRYDKSPCHQADVQRFLRIVGYLTPIDSWSEARRQEYSHRQFYSSDVF